MTTIRPYNMHESGAIPGVPGPNNGLWPGGITVYVDEDTMTVVSTSLIGGPGGPVELASTEDKPADEKPAEAPAQAPKAPKSSSEQTNSKG